MKVPGSTWQGKQDRKKGREGGRGWERKKKKNKERKTSSLYSTIFWDNKANTCSLPAKGWRLLPPWPPLFLAVVKTWHYSPTCTEKFYFPRIPTPLLNNWPTLNPAPCDSSLFPFPPSSWEEGVCLDLLPPPNRAPQKPALCSPGLGLNQPGSIQPRGGCWALILGHDLNNWLKTSGSEYGCWSQRVQISSTIH